MIDFKVETDQNEGNASKIKEGQEATLLEWQPVTLMKACCSEMCHVFVWTE